jgi:hypothetical protein
VAILAGQRLTAQVWQDNVPHTITGGYAATTVAVSTPTATPTQETVYLTSGSMTLRNGRAFKVTVSTLVTGNSADKARLWVRRTGLTGSVLMDTQQVSIDLTGSNGRRTFLNVVSNQTGADLTGVIVATIARASGTAGVVGTNASATSPSYLQIEDIGAATDFPTATSIS